ncbi:carbonic anhydrase family protein [Puniceicoccus vermicola]|uniref:Carbonic anhydrase n=1 Tax=Puniceicoccus vermicola TaxID=388746 RepID=A0A7X1AZE0_9BACT|nr:carbonic anhydrase family protein [Puniceicoccus vermicola]MBC2601753.1 carbonic anhydrase [Puniceicoccus vermicola]
MKTKTSIVLLASLISFGGLFGENLPLTQEEQAALTPQEVLQRLMDGNARFQAGETSDPNVEKRVQASAGGQYPEAVILSCLDSRVPPELVFDSGIGDIFVGRIAGNIENDDLLGSMEFATALSGARLVMVLGHTSCGAVRGACDGAEFGHLTGLLEKIEPAIEQVEDFDEDERSGTNSEFVDAVAAENVLLTMANIREKSEILAELEESGDIMIVGGIYDLGTGSVTLLEE